MSDGVRLAKFQKRLEAERFLHRVNILALQVLNALRLDCLCIGQFDDSNRNARQFGEFGRSEAACSGNDFILVLFRLAYQERG